MRLANPLPRRAFCLLLLAGLAVLFTGPSAHGEKLKSLSGKIRRVEGNRITIKKSGLVRSSEVTVEMTDDTKQHGQVAAGMHIEVKYREEKDDKGETRLIAVEIETRPEYASKAAKKLQKREP